jgi:outer membrane protein OmpA-like peptidoglycan-associated protein/tetratricopeptide (TPR) repeat protein
MIKQVILFLFFILSVNSFSQVSALELNEKRKKEIKNLGREAERNGKYYLALEYYRKLVDMDTANIKNQIHLADLLRYTRNYKEAETHYQTICKIDVNEYPEALFYLATMQKANGKHKEAITNLEKFKKLVKKVEDKKFKKLLEAELQGCNLAITLKDSITKATIISVGSQVNNPHIDFSPIPLTDEQLIFGSLRETEEKFYKIKEDDIDTVKLPTRKFYVAQKQDNDWKFEGEWKGPFNSTDADIANGTFSLDQQRFYFTKCSQNWQFKVVCKIYYSEKKGEDWLTPQLLDEQINMPGFTSTHPSMGRESKKNQEVMYFVSDREKGKGGLDIWYCEYDARKKTFRKPKNAGSSINTAGTEMTPFYDIKTKTLYYSTDGKPNIGGLDLYKTQGETNKWAIPVNLGLPFNSYADDLDFAVKPSGKGGFIVSNREGGLSIYNPTCCDDIYEFRYKTFIELIYKGYIVNKDSNDCIEGESIINVYITGKDGRLLSETFSMNGCKYELKLKPGFEYEIEVRKDNYFSNNTKISTMTSVRSDSIKKNIAIEKIPETPILIPKINYDFDSDKLTKDSKTALDTSLVKILTDNPSFKIEIRSHTDNKGADAYNLKLSQKRAESVVRYLVEKGFSPNRFIAKGYGETLPIAPNSNPDGSDSPVGRQKNRRTEFKIIGNIDPSMIEYDTSDSEPAKSKDTKENEESK